ncbi:MAG: hypothetical protein ABIN11_04740 [candidate division WOR-3 bacterium]
MEKKKNNQVTMDGIIKFLIEYMEFYCKLYNHKFSDDERSADEILRSIFSNEENREVYKFLIDFHIHIVRTGIPYYFFSKIDTENLKQVAKFLYFIRPINEMVHCSFELGRILNRYNIKETILIDIIKTGNTTPDFKNAVKDIEKNFKDIYNIYTTIFIEELKNRSFFIKGTYKSFIYDDFIDPFCFV